MSYLSSLNATPWLCYVKICTRHCRPWTTGIHKQAQILKQENSSKTTQNRAYRKKTSTITWHQLEHSSISTCYRKTKGQQGSWKVGQVCPPRASESFGRPDPAGRCGDNGRTFPLAALKWLFCGLVLFLRFMFCLLLDNFCSWWNLVFAFVIE